MFEGEGLFAVSLRKGPSVGSARVLVSGAGGVGSAIVAVVAGAGVAELALFDAPPPTIKLWRRFASLYPAFEDRGRLQDPLAWMFIVNRRARA